MTKTEAHELLKQFNLWRRGDWDGLEYYPSSIEIGKAIDTVTQPNEIADSIRKTAIDGREYGVIESHILHAFLKRHEHYGCGAMHYRTFLLFVAEALES